MPMTDLQDSCACITSQIFYYSASTMQIQVPEWKVDQTKPSPENGRYGAAGASMARAPKKKKRGEKRKKKRKEGGTKLPTCSNVTK
jgi:hypothetical protein